MTSLEVVALVGVAALLLGYLVAEEDETAVGAVTNRTSRAAGGVAKRVTGQRLLAGGGFLGGLLVGEQLLAVVLGFVGGAAATIGLGGGISDGMLVVAALLGIILLGYYKGGR